MLNVKNLCALVLSLLSVTAFAGQTLQISQQALLNALKNSPEKITILDVRSASEYKQGHIAGAINISYDKIQENLNSLAELKNTTLILHCRSGRRAAVAAEVLAAHDFKNLRHLAGDMNAWVAAKLPLVSNE